MNQQLIKLAETTLLILEKRSLHSIKIDEVYNKTNINKKNLQNKVNNKRDLLRNINNYFDFKLGNIADLIDKSTRKDMIFEIIMMRFDILQIHRKPIIKIFEFFKKKPQELVFLLPSLIESMILMAGLAKIPIVGIKGNLKVKGLLVIYFSSFLVWAKDNSESLEKTMTSLDNHLDRAGKLLSIIKI
ncbi:MAG: hypothetical protein HVK41_05635 [Pelagibacteraceae bacterium]|jgi:hypothetical protein|nr:hypothetical protein [Pelagibacteraceae bacterium]HJO14209.1 hypothetical protein [Alphaproteobacteria bacterium]MBO6468442.1 hypothetical protein [Pelagibacteraceae bacterium]MBO6470482.1 hypothetical protein [Pelagibacteraceae bacterium]MBO6471332.1 hypothetical protein [Pelagibacteraceae bacterium]|tara:strand:+ start:104 stop:664 length:561 start_codon:yes stop_codon:yes gene_type:complete